MVKFLRTSTLKKVRLGLRRKKKQKWRRARGRHNKIREKKKGKLQKVEIGFRTREKERGKILGKIPVFVKNLSDAEKIKKEDLVIIAKVGKRKRLEIEKKIEEKGGGILNFRKNES